MARVRAEQVAMTRDRILSTAERLFAERGVSSVSNRQISEAAGQGNNYAVGYHFGGRTEVIRAVLDRRNAEIEPIRQRMLDDLGPESGVREWICALVLPQTEYLQSEPVPTYFARFCALVTADPELRNIMYDAAAASEGLLTVLDGMYRALPELPPPVRQVRDTMARNVIVHTLAEFELTIAAGDGLDELPSWSFIGHAIVDALVGLWSAPVVGEH